MVFKRFPDDWKEWIADCLMMQVPEADIRRFLVEKGFTPSEADKEMRTAAAHPYVIAGTKLARKMKRRDWLLRLEQTLHTQSGYFDEIERRDNISREEFYKHYHAMNRPVILTNAIKHWDILDRWTMPYIKDTYGAHDVEVMRLEKLRQYRDVLPFGEFIDTITNIGPSAEWYMTNGNKAYNDKTIGAFYAEAPQLPELLNPEGDNPQGWVLMGPEGSLTDLHFDLANNFFCQIRGRKHFRVIPPQCLPFVYPYKDYLSLVDLCEVDHEKFPLFQQAKVYDFIIEPGEVFFLPIGWWHHVISLDVSISLSFSNFYVKEGYHQYRALYGQHPGIDD